MKFIINPYVLLLSFLTTISSFSQEIIVDSIEIEAPKTIIIDSAENSIQRVKLDGVAAVIGDFVILDSDIDKQFIQLEAGGISTKDITRCQLFGKLLETSKINPASVSASPFWLSNKRESSIFKTL